MARLDLVPWQYNPTNEERALKQSEAGEESNMLAYSTGYGSNQEEEYNLPLGCRFSPHGDELITHYLMNKILGQQLPSNVIRDIDLYAHDPRQLPISEFKHGKPNEAYFFTCLENIDGKRQQRRTKSGYWKTTGRDKQIPCGETIVGFRRFLIFYEGKAPRGTKSHWIMHEFRVNPVYFSANTVDQTVWSKVENYVLCKIWYKRKIDAKGRKRELKNQTKSKQQCSQY